jgi:glycosyltransferase involved in cell wall biosynthesis
MQIQAKDQFMTDEKQSFSGHVVSWIGENPKANGKINVAFVTHFCPHYRIKTFETLARAYSVDYLFYSPGNEWYGQGITGAWRGDFNYEYLPGFQLTRSTRVAPSVITRLWRKQYDVFVKCINGRFALPVTYLVARLQRKPFVLWTGIWMTLQTRFHRIAFPVTRWIYRHADSIVVYGEHVKRYLIQLGIESEKIFVAAHAIDNAAYNTPVCEQEKIALRNRLSVKNRKVVLYLGRLEEIKGLNYLIRAFARLRADGAVLLLAGDGSLRKSLEALAKEKDIENNIRFAGYVAPEDTQVYYAIADLLVLPSVTMPTGKETWGLVVNEAMNQGVPVVATDAVGAAAGGLVQDGANGFVVPERDSSALAQAIKKIVADEDLQKQMSENARRIVAGWDNERMVSGFQRAIDYAIKHSRFRQSHEKLSVETPKRPQSTRP